MKILPSKIIKILFVSFLLFALIKPDSLEYLGFSWLNYILVFVDFFMIIILSGMVILKKYKVSHISKILIYMNLCVLLSTIIMSSDIISYIKIAGPIIALSLLIDYSMQKNPEIFFKSFIFLIFTLYLINLITIFIYYPNGMYQMQLTSDGLYFMGYDNGMIYNLLPLCGMSLLYSYAKYNKLISKVSIISILLTLISVLYVKSGSGIIQIIVFIIILLFINNKIMKKIINPHTFFVSFLGLTILIVFFRIQNYFSWLFVDILGKDLTFTGRTQLWDYTIPIIINNILIGVGITGGRPIIGINGHSYPHPHCLILDILYKGGLLYLSSFFLLLHIFSKKYYKSQNDKIKNIILITIFAFLVGEIVNSVPYKIFFWGFFVLIEYTEQINNLFNNRGVKYE